MPTDKSRQSKEEIMSYPYHTIKYSVDVLKQVDENGGSMRFLPKKDISVITGLSDASLITRLSAFNQYGFLNYRNGDGYKLTDLYQQIISPVYDTDSRAGLLQAMKNPPLFAQLIEDVNGKNIPSVDGLVNHLKSKYKMIPTSAARAANCFIDNAEYLGLIDDSNRFKFLMPSPDGGKGKSIENPDSLNQVNPPDDERPQYGNEKTEKMFTYPIPLTGGKIAVLKYDKGLTSQDIKVLKLAIEVLAATIPDNAQSVVG